MAINNPRRQEKKRAMNILKLKTGKQYRNWEKKQRKIKKERIVIKGEIL